jgi:hypothetical protein
MEVCDELEEDGRVKIGYDPLIFLTVLFYQSSHEIVIFDFTKEEKLNGC